MKYVFIALLAFPALSQLPPSGKLSETDLPLFRAEIVRTEKVLASSAGNCWVMNELARTWAAGQQYSETIDWLKRIAGMGVGLDPARDSLYKALRGTREFEAILSRTRESNPPVSTSREAFRIAEGDLTPESSAYDPVSRRFFFGSIRKGVIVRCDAAGGCSRFAEGLGTVLGVKIARGYLWAVSNQNCESALVEFNLRSAQQEHRYSVPGKGHSLNDIALAANGDVYASDTSGGAVWKLRRGAASLEQFLPAVTFRFANGIAVAPDGKTLYVSNYPDGITVVDLRNGAIQPIGHGTDLCLALVDGLYFYGRGLIAIQNGSMASRVVRLRLSKDLRRIEKWEVLERGNKVFEGMTGGTIAGKAFYFAANIQDERDSGARFDPIVVLKAPI